MTTCFLTEFHLFISSLVSTSLLGFSVVKISLWSSTSGYLIPLGILLSSWLPSRDFTYYFQGISPLPLVQFSLWFYFSLCSQNHIFCFLMWIYLSLSLPEFFKPLKPLSPKYLLVAQAAQSLSMNHMQTGNPT